MYGTGPDAVTALGPLSLDVPAGSFLVIVGASGCGKSTLLRLIAGFEEPTSGRVRIGDSPPTPGKAPGSSSSSPGCSPGRAWAATSSSPCATRASLVRSAPATSRSCCCASGLRDVAHRRTWQISGGQQQRVAIARALASDNPLLLLDEPFAALDALTRERLQEDLRLVSAQTGRTSVFVTHSVEEAVFLGSRVVVLTRRPGRIALDLDIPLPRTGLEPDELRALPEYAALRATVSQAVRTAAT